MRLMPLLGLASLMLLSGCYVAPYPYYAAPPPRPVRPPPPATYYAPPPPPGYGY